jgi:hypothetical protein
MAEERLQRRLAAILSADVVGYSRLMGIDEAGTLSRLNALKRELIDPTIAAHSGRIVKLIGDGALMEFASAVDAVTCAIEIQRQLRARAGNEADPIQFRIGINVTSSRVSPVACWLVVAPSRRASFKLRELYKKSPLPAEVCGRMRRDGGSVFPAHANTGDPLASWAQSLAGCSQEATASRRSCYLIIGSNLGFFSPSLFYRSQRHEAGCALPVSRNG